MKFIKNNLLLIIVDVLASTEKVSKKSISIAHYNQRVTGRRSLEEFVSSFIRLTEHTKEQALRHVQTSYQTGAAWKTIRDAKKAD